MRDEINVLREAANDVVEHGYAREDSCIRIPKTVFAALRRALGKPE